MGNVSSRGRRTALAAAAIAIAAIATGVYAFGTGAGESTARDPIVHVTSGVAGRVVRVRVRGDQPVEAGDVLIEIDPQQFATALARANASVAEAWGKLEQSRWRLTIAGSERTIAVAALIALQDLREKGADPRAAQLALIAAQARQAAAEARVQLLRAQVYTSAARVLAASTAAESARRDLADTQIRAPRAGRVTRPRIEPGEYVHVGQELVALGPEGKRSDARVARLLSVSLRKSVSELGSK